MCSALVLVPRAASLGAAAAVTLAMLSGSVAACRTFLLAPVLRSAWLGALTLVGAISLGIIAILRTSAPISFTVATAVFVVLLFGSGVLEFTEVRKIARGLAPGTSR